MAVIAASMAPEDRDGIAGVEVMKQQRTMAHVERVIRVRQRSTIRLHHFDEWLVSGDGLSGDAHLRVRIDGYSEIAN